MKLLIFTEIKTPFIYVINKTRLIMISVLSPENALFFFSYYMTKK